MPDVNILYADKPKPTQGYDRTWDDEYARLINADQIAALRIHETARASRTASGPADMVALHTLAVMNSWPLNAPIYPGSVRYWALVALYERKWTDARGGKLFPHEKLGAAVFEANYRIVSTADQYRPYSAFTRVFAAERDDLADVARATSISRTHRLELLRDWRAKRRIALRAFLVAVERYKRARAAINATAA